MMGLYRAASLCGYFVTFGYQAAGSPLVDRAVIHETDGAKRTGDGYIIRIPFMGDRPTIGFVIGRWSGK